MQAGRLTAMLTSLLGNGYVAVTSLLSCDWSNHSYCTELDFALFQNLSAMLSLPGTCNYLVQLRVSDVCTATTWNLWRKHRGEAPYQGYRRQRWTWTSSPASFTCTWTNRGKCFQVLKSKMFFQVIYVMPRSEYTTRFWYLEFPES